MIKTRILNVGHGEAISIRIANKRKIIRDYGRSRFAKNTLTSVDPISINNLANLSPIFLPKHGYHDDIVLSHAHEDHFNGFKHLFDLGFSKLYENAFIPLIDMESLGGILIKYSLVLYRYYGPQTLVGKNARNWLLAAPVLASLANKLWCVLRNHTIKQWPCKNRVLWPDSSFQQKRANSMITTFNNFLKKNNLNLEHFDEDTENILSLISSYYEQSDDNSKVVDFDHQQNRDVVDKITTILETENSELQELINKRSLEYLYYQKFKPEIDNNSLVFEVCSGTEKHLYLSDADDSVVRRICDLNGLKNTQYTMIKTGHHGNRGAAPLGQYSIKAKSAICCCGPAHPRYKGPDIDYTSIAQDVLCTDWNDNSPKWKDKSSFQINNGPIVHHP